ncbi:coiled-coil domain-containing protein 81 [Anser cygnoides]|uniref:coiled-coil domain-containing protein 81 n=1 Tax=Anser cygnoides TaxID=8845 RepID=UPI0034D27906
MYLSSCIASELNIDFVFRDVGILSVKHKEVQMRFYEKFLLSLDATGNIKEVLGNRKKGMTSWVISQGEPGVPDILTKPDILFPSLQGKTEYGEFFLKSLCERPTKPLQEKKMKDFFKKKTNKKGVLSALPHNRPVKVKTVGLEEGPGEKMKRRESSVRRLSGVRRSSWEEVESKEALEAKAQTAPPVPERYIEALEEMEKLTVERHSRRVLTAAAPGKEKKAEADWAECEAQRAETNTHRTQLKTPPETHKKGHELNLGATRGERQKTDESQEGCGRAAFEK